MLNKNFFSQIIKEVRKNKSFSIVAVYLIVFSFFVGMFTQQLISRKAQPNASFTSSTQKGQPDVNKIQDQVVSKKGYVFKVKWGDLGKRMVDDGVIDETKLAQAVGGKDTLADNLKKYLDGSNQTQIELTAENAHFWVDVLWGLGLANKNEILDKGPMVEGGQTANFASTGGWTAGKNPPMELYSKFSYITLDTSQQAIVKEIADGVYRPCCGNPTSFPDCNHGMAALGLIELMVSQGFSKDEIYKTVLAFNTYWFPQTYVDIAYYLAQNGKDYTKTPASELLSKTYSSGMGYGAIKKKLQDSGAPTVKQSGGCGA